MKPKVSILCITFNHSQFIRQALDGFVTQKTDFPFEIIVHDDKSTDGTEEIIREYAKKYPDIIKPIFEKENQYSKRNFEFIKDMYIQSKSEYIATCEGDDYWIDPHKLQTQVDYLDSHPEAAVCFHPTKVIFQNKEEKDSTFPEEKNPAQFTVENLLKANFIQTSSAVYRRRASYEDMFADAVPGDWYTHLYHAQDGKIGFISKPMSVYRRHEGGVWWESSKGEDGIWPKFGVAHYAMFCEVFELFKNTPTYREIVQAHIYRTYGILLEVDRRRDTDLAKQATDRYPNSVDSLVVSLGESVRAIQKVANEERATIQYLNEKINSVEHDLQQKNVELRAIKTSSAWKKIEAFRSVKSKLKGQRGAS